MARIYDSSSLEFQAAWAIQQAYGMSGYTVSKCKAIRMRARDGYSSVVRRLPSMHPPFGSIPCTQGQEKGRLISWLNNSAISKEQIVALAYFMSLEIRFFLAVPWILD